MATIEGILATVKTCYQCGSCSASCPARRFTDEFNPVRMARLILLGFKKDVLSSPSIWLCANCNSCMERCPRGISFVDVIRELQNEAVREGAVPPQLSAAAKSILENGWLYSLTESDESRTAMGLPPLPKADVAAVKKLAKQLELEKLLGE